jgi:phage terminase large subunit-like protein
LNLAASLTAQGIEPAVLLKQLQDEWDRRASENRLAAYAPYAKQREFHAMGATKRERLLLAGNQLGKTLAAGMEVAMHLTGNYADDWEGKRFAKPVVAWVSGVTAEATRDGAQRILLGRAGSLGTGTIPGKNIIGAPLSRPGVADAVAIVKVRHVTGGTSTLIFKSYDQGREKWQGDTIDVLWPDEEPPEEIYTEGLTRTNAGDGGKGGICLMTFTPLLGMSNVVKRFLMEDSRDRGVVTMTIDDVGHYSDEQKASIIASYPAHEREARTKGIPTLGSGRVFPVTEESISWQLVPLPRHFPRIIGMDLGWDHPTAAGWLTYDPDADIIYVTDAYRVREQTPIIHAASIKARSKNEKIPVAWPHDGLQHDKGSGIQLAQQYRDQGLEMLPEHATFMDGSNGLEAGVVEMLTRMQTGRFKVAAHLTEFFEEFRLYHRKPTGPLGIPQIVKIHDDLISAIRYGMMMLRFARVIQSASDSYSAKRSAASNNPWLA